MGLDGFPATGTLPFRVTPIARLEAGDTPNGAA